MNVVFFGEDLNARAPHAVGCLFDEGAGGWTDLIKVAQALRGGEAVQIRQATETERKRAEALTEIYELSALLGARLCQLYENQGAGVAEDAIFELHRAIMDAQGEYPTVQLLDKVEA